MRRLLVFLLLLSSLGAVAQEYTIQGRVVEEHSAGLPGASVLILLPRDSTVIAYSATNAEGFFALKAPLKGYYVLKVTSLGYGRFLRTVPVLSNARVMNLGVIALHPESVGLADVVVKGTRSVVVKQDTLEYNAALYGVQPNADVEQLLLRLPGVDVQGSGNISVQGEKVTRIFINGKELFGRDLEAATKNLPAEAIEKVQLIDRKSEEARFSGVDDGQRDKVINLTVKKDWLRSGFGKVSLGGGTSDSYAARATYSRLNGDNLLTVSGSSNNVNNRALSNEAAGPSAGFAGGGGVGQPGRVTTHSAGLNLYNQLSSKTSLSGSYLFRQTAGDILSSLVRQNFLPQGTAFYYENSRQATSNTAHTADLELEHKDSVTTLRLTASLSATNPTVSTNNNRQSYSVTDSLVNAGIRNYSTRNPVLSAEINSFFGQRLGKKGRLFTNTSQFTAIGGDINGLSQSLTNFATGTSEVLSLSKTQSNREVGFNSRLAYREPLSKTQYLEASYAASNRTLDADLRVFDIATAPPKFDPDQSRRFGSQFLYQQAGLAYHLSLRRLTLGLGVNAQDATLTGRSEATSEKTYQRYRHLLPNLSLNAHLNRFTRLVASYSTAIQPPTIDQLQPVVSRFDPLNQYLGNPNLLPEYRHQGQASLRTVHTASGIIFSANANVSYILDPITAAVAIDSRQVRTTRFVNATPARIAAASLAFTVPLKALHSQFDFGPYARQSSSAALLNGGVGTVVQRAHGGSLGASYRYRDAFFLSLRSNVGITKSTYELVASQDRRLLNTNSSAEASLLLVKRLSVASQFYYTALSDNSGFAEDIPVLNFSLSALLGKARRAAVTLAAFNVLNIQTGASQVVTTTYVEQSTQNFLGCFYTWGFSYSFNQHRSQE